MLYLASASPRRAELLTQIDVPFEVLAVDIDESVMAGELPEQYVMRLARAKALSAWQDERRVRDDPVLAADTAVVCAGVIFGKPDNRDHAQAMLRALSANTHQVMTAVCLRRGQTERYHLHVSDVTFRALSAEEVEAYWERGEGKDKAGGYAVQGYAARFITALSGSYSSVMGLPVHLVDHLLATLEFKL